MEKEAIQSGTERFDEIRKENHHIKSKIALKEHLKSEIIMFEKEKKELASKKEESDKKNEEFRNSMEFEEFQEMEKEKTNAIHALKEHSHIIAQSFSSIEKALKKFSRVAFEDAGIIESYSISPLEALADDKELKIVKILEKLQRQLIDNNLDIDEKRREKSLNEIKKLDESFFIVFLHKQKELNDRLEKIEGRIMESRIKEKGKEIEHKSNELSHKLNILNCRLESEKKEIDKIDIESMKKELQGKIREILKEKIIIS